MRRTNSLNNMHLAQQGLLPHLSGRDRADVGRLEEGDGDADC